MSNRFPPDVIAAAQSSGRRYGLFPSVTLAQWALESAYGAKASGKFNYFGIKALPGQAATERMTWEVIAGRKVEMVQRFRDFTSMEDCFDQHGQFLSTKRYAPVRAAKTPQAACKALQECGYATDPLYPQKLFGIITANDLDQHDKPTIVKPAPVQMDAPPIRRPPTLPPKPRVVTGTGIAATGGVVVVSTGAALATNGSNHLWLWAILVGLVALVVLVALHFRKKG